MFSASQKTVVITAFLFSINNILFAQTKGQAIEASVGIGLSASYDEDVDIIGSGFYAQGEYIFGLTKWFAIRPYAGVVFTEPNQDLNSDQGQSRYEVTSDAFLMGAKIRLTAPIPYVAPFFEVGAGMSIGSFVTDLPAGYIAKNGFVPHIPFSMGLALGENNRFELELTYYFHGAVDQFSGAFAFGYVFPIG
ncbi:MAG: hypothetical protein WBG71_08995 [Leeuwenhoekiella sp.]